jgi:hypothetical protein
MRGVKDIRKIVEVLLQRAGFEEDHYFIREDESGISVLFDSKGAVDYFLKEVELSEWNDDFVQTSMVEGKRYVAYIQNW